MIDTKFESLVLKLINRNEEAPRTSKVRGKGLNPVGNFAKHLLVTGYPS